MYIVHTDMESLRLGVFYFFFFFKGLQCFPFIGLEKRDLVSMFFCLSCLISLPFTLSFMHISFRRMFQTQELASSFIEPQHHNGEVILHTQNITFNVYRTSGLSVCMVFIFC